MPKNVFQSKDAKKLPTDANFQTPASTGHKVEMASTNADQRKISMKLFQNPICGFREEDFLRIFSYPYSESSPHSLEPRLMTDQNFANNF